MQVGIIDIMLFVLFFQLISIAPFFLFHKRQNSIANQILGLFLLSKAFCISNFVAMRLSVYMLPNFPHLFFFGSSFTMLWGPLLYYYTKSLTTQNFRFRKIDIPHFIPFFAHFTFLLFRFHLHSAETKRILFSSGTIFSNSMQHAYNLYIYGSMLVYTILAIRLVWMYRSEIRLTLSFIEKQQLSWLIFVLTGFFTKWIFDFWFYINLSMKGLYSQNLLLISRLVLFLFINILIYKAMKQPQLFAGIDYKKGPKKQTMSKSVADVYEKQLLEFMEKQKPYYNPDLTLYDLAELAAIPPRSLSEIINSRLAKNFYDFINSYRISESQKLLSGALSNRKTVLEVLYEVGFNSKSVFNDTFKKTVGMTPTEFKKRQIPV